MIMGLFTNSVKSPALSAPSGVALSTIFFIFFLFSFFFLLYVILRFHSTINDHVDMIFT